MVRQIPVGMPFPIHPSVLRKASKKSRKHKRMAGGSMLPMRKDLGPYGRQYYRRLGINL